VTIELVWRHSHRVRARGRFIQRRGTKHIKSPPPMTAARCSHPERNSSKLIASGPDCARESPENRHFAAKETFQSLMERSPLPLAKVLPSG
jgi:hypothetical protein